MTWIIWLVIFSAQVEFAKQSSLTLTFVQSSSNFQIVVGETTTVNSDIICDECSSSNSVSVHLDAKLDVANVVDLTIPSSLTLKSPKTSIPIQISGKTPGVVVLSLWIRAQHDESVDIRYQ